MNYRANIWALKQLGCTHVLATTATGSLVEDYKPGDLVVLDDFIDRFVTGYLCPVFGLFCEEDEVVPTYIGQRYSMCNHP